jgi:hypothetical protein
MLNLTRLFWPDAGGGAAAAPPAEQKDLPVTIGRVELAGGNVRYSDYYIKPNYSANLTEVAGTVSAMSAQQAGDIAITASLDHSAPVEIRGRVNPFATEIDLDLTGKARDIELPPLSPYSAKYAGYGIEKGTLSFDVHYKVAERRLTAENQIVLDQLTFGERVESPSATKLPVLLAVALLKDRRGVIDVRLPISGSLDDPQFSVGGLIVQVIVNLLTKAVTAPFALIGAVFAGSGGESAWVEFAPGRSDLGPEAQAKIATLAKALADRPQLRLEITGRDDAASDAPALRRLAVDRAVKAEKRRVLAEEGTAPLDLDDVVVSAEEYPRFLEAAYKRASSDKPKNALGIVTTLPAPEMEALLLQHAEASDDALRDLANARAQAVKAAIEKNGEVADARLFLLAPRAGTEGAKDGGKPNRVDFALS